MCIRDRILAKQHYETARELFDEEEIVCLTGAGTAKKKAQQRELIESGKARIIIGTHALLYGDIAYQNLGLIITDEQHRFGVKQRAALSGAGNDVHTPVSYTHLDVYKRQRISLPCMQRQQSTCKEC